MTDILPNITESAVLTVLRTVILSIVGCEVIRGQVNRAAMPKGDFIVLTPTSLIPLSTNIDTYSDTQKSIKRPAQLSVQIDCYGAQSQARSAAIAAILRDEFAANQFTAAGYDMQTLYAGDARQLPIETGQDQYLERWTFEAQIQINPIVTIANQSAIALTADVIDVDATYPPGV